MDITDISSIPSGWAAVGAAALVFSIVFAAATFRKWRRQDEGERKRRENYNAYIAALHEWQDAIDRGDIAEAASIKKDIDRMRSLGWNVAPLLAAILLSLCGCSSPPPAQPPPPPVLLTAHVLIVSPGDTVPPLPEGEGKWYLCTATGLRHLLPEDAPVNRANAQEAAP